MFRASEFAFQPSDEATFQPGDTSVEIDLAAGDVAGCTFENTKRGTINIVKNTVGGDDTFAFTDDIPASGGFTIETSMDDTETFENVVPDTYAVTETSQIGWDLTGLTCADPGDLGSSSVLATGIATIDLDPGETVTCTYTNTKRGTINIVKNTVGGDDTFAFTDDIADDTPSSGFDVTTDAGPSPRPSATWSRAPTRSPRPPCPPAGTSPA